MKRSIAIITMFFLCFGIMAQEKKSDTVNVKASVVCGMCKERIEQGLSFEKGIKDIRVDLDKKEVMVIFNPQKTNAEAIRKAISALGYDADDIAANQAAYEKLPPCCKKGNEKH